MRRARTFLFDCILAGTRHAAWVFACANFSARIAQPIGEPGRRRFAVNPHALTLECNQRRRHGITRRNRHRIAQMRARVVIQFRRFHE